MECLLELITNLKSILANVPGRICLSPDVWIVVTSQNYMTVIAQYVDDKWKLNSKLLALCKLESPQGWNYLERYLEWLKIGQ